ncbi:MAG TPA: hypothetical protein DDW85_02315 [Porphyromonadaceae bacterium]|nr:hypothetical protein [Porphyromonadaceae bacterium]
MLFVGIDTGKNTGYAVWDSNRDSFLEIKTVLIHQAMQAVRELSEQNPGQVIVRVEDPRQRTWFGTERMSRETERSRLQGVGSVKRDATVWEDFLTDLGIRFDMVAPKNNSTKLSPDMFKLYTKWTKRTSEHARDAAMLVFKK